MSKTAMDFDAVREVGLTLPDVEEHSTSWGPSLKVKGRLLACPALHKSVEPNTLMLRMDVGEREALLASQPDVYYLTDHYRGHPAILVRLAKIGKETLRELLEDSRAFVLARASKRSSRRRR